MSEGRLVVVATPIGNLDDLSPRAARALRDADLVACEDTRRTATLLRAAGSAAPMIPSHEHNEASRAADLVRRMREGQTVVLVSDAGMPVISDPGARAVRAAIEAGVPVTVIPGPSAVESAVALSGVPGVEEGYAFAGFLPRKPAERRRVLGSAGARALVAFESPKRVASLLADLAALDPDRPVAVCRELTKLHEEVIRGTAGDLAERLPKELRGEVTVVIGPAPARDEGEASTALAEGMALLIDAGLSPARAAEAAAALGAAPRNAAYKAALAAAESRRAR